MMKYNFILAEEIDDPSKISNWIIQPKIDGERVKLVKHGKVVSLINRRGFEKINKFPEIKEDIIPDGEFDGELFIPSQEKQYGSLSLTTTRSNASVGKVDLFRNCYPAKLILFDLLKMGNKDWQNVSYALRYNILKKLFAPLKCKSIFVIDNFSSLSEAMEIIEEYDIEGLIFRNPRAKYFHGRSKDVLKWKRTKKETFDVGFFTQKINEDEPMKNKRISALGLYANGKFKGKVNCLVSDEDRVKIFSRWNNLTHEEGKSKNFLIGNPFQADVEFRLETNSGKLRNATLLKLRGL